jgi:hypothetical protein
MKKVLVVLAAAFATAAIAVTPAFAASGTVNWTVGQGTYHECEGAESPGLHWVFTTGGGNVTSATLTINNSEVLTMSGNSQGSQYDADSSGATEPTSASVVWVGELGNGNANLVISHGCFGGETTTTTTTTGGPTTSTTTGGPTTSTTTAGPTTSTTSGGPTSTSAGPTTGSGGVLGSTTGGTTGGTAPSSGTLPFTGLPIWIPLLAAASLLASGIMLIRRRKGEIS